MEIRELIPENSPEDMALLVPTYLQIWNHSENLPFLSFSGRPFTEAQLREWFGHHLAAGIRYFGAMRNGGLAGILLVQLNPIEGFELLAIGVLSEAKRRGLGAGLVDHGVAVARQQGFKGVDAQVFATNAPMLCLLLGRGFIPIGMEYHRGPAGEDLVRLKKFF